MPTFTENIHTTPTLQEFIDKNPNTVLEPTKALYAVDTMRLYQGDGTNKLKDIVPFYYREELNVKISNDVSKVPFFEVGDTIIATTSQINKLYEYNLEETQDMIQEATKKAEDDNAALEKKLTDKITETKNTNYVIMKNGLNSKGYKQEYTGILESNYNTAFICLTNAINNPRVR